jgi:zinc resistance-associated protein
MKKVLLAAVSAVVLAGSAYAISAYAAADDNSSRFEMRMQLRAAMLDDHIAGLKAGLHLTADQEKNWAAFEGAIRAIVKDRMERMRQMREARKDDSHEFSPIDRMRMRSDRLAKGSADLKTLADAATPLYASLDETQKRDFGPLFRDFVREGRREAMNWRTHRHGGMDGEERGAE